LQETVAEIGDGGGDRAQERGAALGRQRRVGRKGGLRLAAGAVDLGRSRLVEGRLQRGARLGIAAPQRGRALSRALDADPVSALEIQGYRCPNRNRNPSWIRREGSVFWIPAIRCMKAGPGSGPSP